MIKAGGDENFAVPNSLISVGTSIGIDWDSILYIACSNCKGGNATTITCESLRTGPGQLESTQRCKDVPCISIKIHVCMHVCMYVVCMHVCWMLLSNQIFELKIEWVEMVMGVLGC